MTDTNHAGSRNEDGERRCGSCLGYVQYELEIGQRTDYLAKQVPSAHWSRGVVMELASLFRYQTGHDRFPFPFFLQY